MYILCGEFIRLNIYSFGDNSDDDSFGYKGRISYGVTLLRK